MPGSDAPPPSEMAELLFYRAAWDKLGLNVHDIEKMGADRIFRWLAMLGKAEEVRAMFQRLENQGR